jgi:hypothetical protein
VRYKLHCLLKTTTIAALSTMINLITEWCHAVGRFSTGMYTATAGGQTIFTGTDETTLLQGAFDGLGSVRALALYHA